MKLEDIVTSALTHQNLSAPQILWAAQQMVDFVVKLSPEGNILSVMLSRTADALDLCPASLVGLPVHLFLAENDIPTFKAALQQVNAQDGFVMLNLQLLKSDGSPLWMEGLMGRVTGELPGYKEIVLALRDVSAWKQEVQRLSLLNSLDALTGLRKRSQLPEQIQACARQSLTQMQPFTLMALELEGFQEIKDSYGHPTGEALLKQVAKRLEQVLQRPDAIFQSASDEFVLLLPPGGRDADADTMLAQRVLHSLSRPFQVDSHNLRLTSSIGIVRCPEHWPLENLNAEELLRNAELAMHYARERGKNNFACFNQQMADAKLRQQRLAEEMYEAVGNGEFVLHYQPIHDEAGQLVGMEALMRWPRQDGMSISPAEFIPIAEERGLINLLGAWALRTACHQVAYWKKEYGLDGFYIAVNVSPQQFTDDGFVRLVQQAVAEAGIDPHRLVLEITEGVLMADPELAEAMLTELAQMGVQIAVDDFGTGYSSLAYLKKFKLSTLKIDKSFIDGVPHDKGDCTIVGAVLGMARELGLSVVAEGVETAEQQQWLQERGCSNMQGYYYCRPVAPQQIIEKYLPAK